MIPYGSQFINFVAIVLGYDVWKVGYLSFENIKKEKENRGKCTIPADVQS